jgi:PadR family transcriptional regulator, regulatory protein PadR
MVSSQNSAEFKRLQTKLSVDILWVYILKLLHTQSLHGYAIRKKVEQEFGFQLGEVTGYVVLYKLKQRGFVRTKQAETKTLYYITAAGKQLFKTAKKEWNKRGKQLF